MDQRARADSGSTIHQAGRDIVYLSGAPDATIGPSLLSIDPPWGRLDNKVRGRDALVTEIAGEIADPRGSIFVLHGGGGYGKSTVALAAAKTAVEKKIPAYWISGADQTQFLEGMRSIALRFGAPVDSVDRAWSGKGSAPDLLWQAIGNFAEPWLIVLDNIDEPQILAAQGSRTTDGTGWLRVPRARGTLVITTRDGNHKWWPTDARLIAIPTLTISDGCQVLLDSAGISAGSTSHAAYLARRLGCLPLALKIASAYIADAIRSPQLPGLKRPRTFQEYSNALEEDFSELSEAMAVNLPKEHTVRDLISNTWELSLDLLEARGYADGRPLLRLLSCFGPAFVPYKLLDAGVLADVEMFSDITPQKMSDLLRALADLGLIERYEGTRGKQSLGISLHPVIRDANRSQPDVRSALDEYATASTLLLENFCAGLDPDAPECASSWRVILPHCSQVLSLWKNVSEPSKINVNFALRAAMVAGKSASFLYRYGRYLEAETLLGKVLVLQSNLLRGDYPESLETRYNLARVWRAKGSLIEAEKEFRSVVEAQCRLLGKEHKDSLATRNQLGFVLRAQGRHPAAEREFRDVLRIQEFVLGSEDKDTLLTRHNLGQVLFEEGQFEKAEQELEAVLTLRRSALGEEHAHTLFTRYILARVAYARGRWLVAEESFRSLLEIQTGALGAMHPDTLATRTGLGRSLVKLDRKEDAKREFESVLKGQRRALGNDHPDTVNTIAELQALL